MEEQNKTIEQLNAEGREFMQESLKGIKANSYKGIINAPAAMREIVSVIEKYDLSFNQARRLLTDTADFLGGCKMKTKTKSIKKEDHLIEPCEKIQITSNPQSLKSIGETHNQAKKLNEKLFIK